MTNREKYRELCETESSIPIYSKAFWMDAVCGDDNWDVMLYEKGGSVLGALPYYIKEKFGLRYLTQPPFTQHNGAWIKYPKNQQYYKRISLEKEVLTALIEQVEALPICYYQQSYSPSLTNWLPLYWKGYKQTTRYTYRLNNIRDSAALLAQFQYRKRRNVSKARENHLSLQFDLSAHDFYDVHKKSLAKQGDIIQYSFELFERMYNAVYAHDAGRVIYLINDSSEILCAMFNVWDKNWGYDLITAFDPDGRKVGAPDLLVYSMLEYLSDKVLGYDFEGSMIEGVEESFRHFGAVQTPYFAIHKTYTSNPLVRYFIQKKLG